MKREILIDSQVTKIEEPMEVGTKKDSVVDPVNAAFRDRFDVSRFEYGKSFFSGRGTASVIRIGDQSPEGPLTQAGIDEGWFSIDLAIFVKRRDKLPNLASYSALLDRPPKISPFRFIGRKALARDNIRRPAWWDWDPVATVEEEWREQKQAADLIRLVRSRDYPATPPISLDLGTHFFRGARPILFFEILPSNIHRKARCRLEEPSADDIVVWRVKLKKEWFSRLKHFERAEAHWQPEVHLAQVPTRAQELEPGVIGDSDPELTRYHEVNTLQEIILGRSPRELVGRISVRTHPAREPVRSCPNSAHGFLEPASNPACGEKQFSTQ